MIIKSIDWKNHLQMQELLKKISLFTKEECDVVMELLDATKRDSDYIFYACLNEKDELESFICFGPTPMTKTTYDMYWIGTADQSQKKGLARLLMNKMKDVIASKNGKLIRIETSSKETYEQTREFYKRMNMVPQSTITNFYDIGDDLITYIITL